LLKMAFWQENYPFIKDVYNTRVCKMVEWMDQLEMSIGKVMATKVYTSNEFKRERDNFTSLCKNLERSDTKKWLNEVMEVLFRDRNVEEKKEETKRLEEVIERHKLLLPRVKDTQVKSEIFWKCYEYGDNLVNVFEFIDDQRSKSVRDITITDPEVTEEFIDKHGSIVRLMENKKKTVEEFLQQGEKLMELPGSPKFLETHVNKLKEAWAVANEEAQKRKNGLADNLEAWKNFEEKRVDGSRMLDMADAELKSLRKNYNMERAPIELQEKVKVAVTMRFDIEDLFKQAETAFKTLSIFAPKEKAEELGVHITTLNERLEVLTKIDKFLAELLEFNKAIVQFDAVLTSMDSWINGKGQEKLAALRQPDADDVAPDPEERVTRGMELMEDLMKRIQTCVKAEQTREQLFPPEGKKMSKDAKEFLDRLKACRDGLDKLDENVTAELNKFSIDVKHFADYQCGVRCFYPWLLSTEEKVEKGIEPPSDLVSACNLLGVVKTFQDDCLQRAKVLDDANSSAEKMTYHNYAQKNIEANRARWSLVHTASSHWVAQMTNLVECWNSLDGKTVELSSWVQGSDSAQVANNAGISIEKLENQLIQLKATFSEKEKMLENLKTRCGPNSEYPALGSEMPESGSNSAVEGTDLVATEEAEVASDKMAEEQEGEKAQEQETAAE